MTLLWGANSCPLIDKIGRALFGVYNLFLRSLRKRDWATDPLFQCHGTQPGSILRAGLSFHHICFAHVYIYIIYTCNYIYFFPSSWTPISCSIRGGFGNLLGKGSKMPCRPFHVKTPSLFPGSSKPNKLASHGGVFFLLDLACASWLLQVMWLFPSY